MFTAKAGHCQHARTRRMSTLQRQFSQCWQATWRARVASVCAAVGAVAAVAVSLSVGVEPSRGAVAVAAASSSSSRGAQEMQWPPISQMRCQRFCIVQAS